MATEIREIEWKYDAAPGAPLPDLTGLPQVDTQSEPDEQILEATYYDTDALDLARVGITMRRRLGGDDAGWHVKLPEGSGSRAELRLPPGEQIPGEFTTLLTARLRGRLVRPVARITTTRQSSRLRDRGGVALAEVVVDQVVAQTMIGEPAVRVSWNEVEVELADGGGDGGLRLLKAADRRLRRSGLRRSRHASKLEAVLSDRLPAAAAEREPTGSSSAGEVLLAYLRGQVEALLSWDPMVRRDLPDSVHQMRVCARRLRSALQTFRGLLRQEETEPLIGELRWLGEVLGRARDDEVLREHLTSGLDSLPAELAVEPVRRRIDGHFAPRQAEARELLLEALGSDRYLALLDSLDRLTTPAALTPAAGRKAAAVLPPLVRRVFRRTRRRMDDAHVAPEGEPQDIALHEARKAAKRARYAAETVAPAVGKEARRTVKALKNVQTTLGDHQDTVIARQAVRQLAFQANSSRENAFTYGLLYGREAERADESREQARKAWKQADNARHTAWMR